MIIINTFGIIILKRNNHKVSNIILIIQSLKIASRIKTINISDIFKYTFIIYYKINSIEASDNIYNISIYIKMFQVYRKRDIHFIALNKNLFGNASHKFFNFNVKYLDKQLYRKSF